MEATVAQEDGLVLSITSCQEPGNEIIRVRLEGTKFHAEITAGNEPSAEESGQLAHFLANAATVKTGQSLSWLSSCQDLLFTVSSEPEFENYIFLRVYIGSNSNDECDWRLNADLLLRPEQLIILPLLFLYSNGKALTNGSNRSLRSLGRAKARPLTKR